MTITEMCRRQFNLPNRLVAWIRRYGLAELLGTTCALLSALTAARLGANGVTIAVAGAWGEVVGFYLPMLVQELRSQWQTRCLPGALWCTMRNLLLEFGPAELLDTALVRPTLITGVVQLVPQLSLGILVGKLLADSIFYGTAIVGRQMSQRLAVSSE